MSNTLVLSSREQQLVVKAAAPAVYAKGRRRRDLKVLSMDLLGPPTFGRAALLLQPDSQVPAEPRLEAVGELPDVGTSVTITAAGPAGGVEMSAVVTGHRAELGPDGERLLAEIEHDLAAALSQTVSERWHVQGGSPVTVGNARVCFNDDLDGLASQAHVSIGQRSARLFDSAANARRWSVADALAYLLAVAVPSDVQAQSRAELDDLAGDIDLGRLDVTGMAVAEALTQAAGRGGLALRAARQGLGLVFYRPGVGGRPAVVNLQPAGQAFSPALTNLWRGKVTFSRRPARRGVLVLGAVKRYESTFYLQPGWNTSLQTARWRDFVRSMSANWPVLGDVYRKWVLNEHAWYTGSPWNLPVADLSVISGADFGLNRPRTLLPCLSCDTTGQSLGIVVETCCGQDQPWRRWRGPLWVSRDECAVYLGGDGLPGEFFQAAAAGEAAVRATATVEADVRLSVSLTGDAALPTAVIDASSRAGWSKVHSSSIFAASGDLGPPAERDDGALLAALAEREAEVLATATSAELVLGWVDTSYFVGDSVEMVEGRALELRSDDDSRPFVRSVHHDFGPGQCTTILVEG